jgi:hypothetical protein
MRSPILAILLLASTAVAQSLPAAAGVARRLDLADLQGAWPATGEMTLAQNSAPAAGSATTTGSGTTGTGTTGTNGGAAAAPSAGSSAGGATMPLPVAGSGADAGTATGAAGSDATGAAPAPSPPPKNAYTPPKVETTPAGVTIYRGP